jgi:ribosomal protein L37E
MVLYCPKCGRKLPNYAIFCLYCGKSIRIERTGYPIASGVLAIVAASISITEGVIFAFAYIQTRVYGYYDYNTYPALAFLGFLAFILGLSGGIMALKRQKFSITVTGILGMLLVSIVSTAVALQERYSGPAFAALFGAPTIVLGLLSCAFVAPRKKEFTSLPKASPITGPLTSIQQFIQCPICGHQSPVESNFCGRCGKPLRKEDTQIY